MIEIKDMTKIYRMGAEDVRALQSVSLRIDKGEFVAIMGPSGSGKSTLMNMIGCLDVPTSGEYYLDGIEVSEMTEDEQAEIRNKKIGFIFQKFNLLAKLTAYENVELPLIYRGTSAEERKKNALAALDKVGLGNRISHTPSELSGGQQQRVAIARALAGDPPVILADEPTGALDTKSGNEVLDTLVNLNNSGITVIVITHDPEVAKRAKRIVRIQDGQILSDEEVI